MLHIANATSEGSGESAQTCQSLSCSQVNRIEVGDGSNQKRDI